MSVRTKYFSVGVRDKIDEKINKEIEQLESEGHKIKNVSNSSDFSMVLITYES